MSNPKDIDNSLGTSESYEPSIFGKVYSVACIMELNFTNDGALLIGLILLVEYYLVAHR